MRHRLALFAVLSLLAVLLTAARPPEDVVRQEASASQTTLWVPQIAVVWPHDGLGTPASVEEARAVNVSVWPRNRVGCTADPRLRLWLARDNEPLQLVPGNGKLTLQTVEDRTFPAIEFNDVPADLDGRA